MRMGQKSKSGLSLAVLNVVGQSPGFLIHLSPTGWYVDLPKRVEKISKRSIKLKYTPGTNTSSFLNTLLKVAFSAQSLKKPRSQVFEITDMLTTTKTSD